MLFYINLLFYVLFCILLTVYIIFGNEANEPSKPIINENTITGTINKTDYHDKSVDPKPTTPVPLEDNIQYYGGIAINRVLLLIFIGLLLLREVVQLILKPFSYLKDPENWLEVSVILLSIAAIVVDLSLGRTALSNSWIRPQIGASAILLSWFALVLLIGKHPLFSVQVEMFRTVSASFIRFLMWYFLLILAFAMSFYVLFRGCTGECSKENPFLDPGGSLFKTLVMLTGELDASSIPFITYIGTSHVIFTAFVFLIAIVLLNLLNGLAVADTKAIRDNAYLYSCIARVRLICFIENLILQEDTNIVKSILTCCGNGVKLNFGLLNSFAGKIVFFPNFIPKHKVIVHLDENNRVECLGNKKTKTTTCSKKVYYTDAITVDDAKRIEALQKEEKKRNENKDELKLKEYSTKLDDLSEKVDNFEKKFEAIEASNKQIENLIIQVMALLSLNNADDDR